MLAWDKHLQPHLKAVVSLTQAQRWKLVLACLEDARPVVDRSLKHMPLPDIRLFFDATLALAHEAPDASQVPTAAAQGLLSTISGWLGDATPPGIWDFSGGLMILLQRAGKELSESDVGGCMSFAYQVVLHAELLSKLDREVLESEVQQMEESNQICMECIAKQIQLIASVRGGVSSPQGIKGDVTEGH